MPKNFVQQAFCTWIKQNQKRFTYPPIQIRYMRGGISFFFSSVIHEISVTVNKNGCNIAFTYKNELLDFLVCFDVSVERDTDGYYCGQCIPGDGGSIEDRFSNRADLVANHVFEPLLEWSNERLRGDVIAQIYQTEKGGSTWVNLVSKEKMKRELNDESGYVRERLSPNLKKMVRVMNVIQGSKMKGSEYYFSLENVCLRWLGW